MTFAVEVDVVSSPMDERFVANDSVDWTDARNVLFAADAVLQKPNEYALDHMNSHAWSSLTHMNIDDVKQPQKCIRNQSES